MTWTGNDGYPTDDGLWFDCHECGGEGEVNRYEEDQLWYRENEWFRCENCAGKGGWTVPWATVEAERYAR